MIIIIIINNNNNSYLRPALGYRPLGEEEAVAEEERLHEEEEVGGRCVVTHEVHPPLHLGVLILGKVGHQRPPSAAQAP